QPKTPTLHMPGARRQGISTAFATRPSTLGLHAVGGAEGRMDQEFEAYLANSVDGTEANAA
ncbi:hypothetical protein, partial [Phaeobacter gallaeciensis]|uniref:hypothetical protein n=1 Tax=Phaeobacter gallaeciensis TaxID=60890 RepID=UPI00237FB907